MPATDGIRRRVTLFDWLLVLGLAAAALGLYLGRGPREPAGEVLAVTARDGSRVIPLSANGRYVFRGPLGESVAEIGGGRVRMLSSPCPNQWCVGQGWKNRGGEAVVCAPNRVGLFLGGTSEGWDAVSR